MEDEAVERGPDIGCGCFSAEEDIVIQVEELMEIGGG
jgi:hypothetical protein